MIIIDEIKKLIDITHMDQVKLSTSDISLIFRGKNTKKRYSIFICR